MKRTKKVEAASSRPVVEVLTQTATDKIVPFAQTAAARAVPLAQTAAARAVPLAQTAAAETNAVIQNIAAEALAFAQNIAAKAAPLAHTAAAAAGPLAAGAAAKAAPFATSAVGRVAPLAGLAAERLGPLATSGASAAHGAVDRIGPAVDAARGHVTDELLPKLTDAVSAATGSSIAAEAARRGKATLAAARGELDFPPEPAARRGGWVKRFAIVAGVTGAVVLVARKLLGGQSTDSGWQAARPSTTFPASTTGTSTSAGVTTTTTSPATSTVGGVEDLGTAGTTGSASYGEGSYVGSEPPVEFYIKGNENAMKYHLPESSAYQATVAEVWFSSTEAAERAGFTRAQG